MSYEYQQYIESHGETNAAEVAALKRAVKSAMKGLTEKQRDALELHYIKGMKQRDIAALWGIDKSGVSRHISRALDNVRKTAM